MNLVVFRIRPHITKKYNIWELLIVLDNIDLDLGLNRYFPFFLLVLNTRE
jgi:hypothetical protein